MNMNNWNDDQIWEEVDAWRWIPPSSKRIITENYELVVTPGSYALSYAYGLKVEDSSHIDHVLKELRDQVQALGGYGFRIQLTSRDLRKILVNKLLKSGYKQIDETEILVWELEDQECNAKFPDFRSPKNILVHEIYSEIDYKNYLNLSSLVFGDPLPTGETLKAFINDFHKNILDNAHSDRFLAFKDAIPIGLAGMEIVNQVGRFFGAGVLKQYRNNGVYGLLVLTRCKEALKRGAKIVLTTARIESSGPILKHHGFKKVGSLHVFEIRW